MARKSDTFIRFTLAQRVEHIIVLLSFTALALTGLPQKYAGTAIAEGVIRILGGIETIRTIHHASAIVFVLLGVYHTLVLAYKIFVRHVEMTMLPGLQDVLDALNIVRYNLGLAKKRPALPRYSFEEKAEYWAMIWGTVVMALTGFMLWNPITVARILPGEVIPAAKAAHGGEALLAVLAIIVWHFYNVHLKAFNPSMFTGRLSRHQMAEEHGEELARLEQGKVRPEPAPDVIQYRQRIFLSVAAPATLVLLGMIFWLATFETTAIATVPTPAATVRVFAPLPTATWTPISPDATVAVAIPHEIAGREQCDTCHGPNGISPYPADHQGRPNESCQICHKPGPTTHLATAGSQPQASGTPADIPHVIQGREQCSMCHSLTGLQPFPADHEGRADTTCTTCHKLAPGISGTPAAGGAAAAPGIPHSIAEDIYKDCTTCHGQGKIKPAPANHADYTVDTCTACHKPAAQATPTATGAAKGTATPAATRAAGTATPTATGAAGTTSSGPAAIPHAIDDAAHKDCLLLSRSRQHEAIPGQPRQLQDRYLHHLPPGSCRGRSR